MENASKALIMAAGVLLSVIIIGVAMFAYRGITGFQKEKDLGLSNAQLSKINDQIEKYTNKSVVYGSEVLSICNAIEDYRKKYPKSEGYPEIQFEVKMTVENSEGKEENDVSQCFENLYLSSEEFDVAYKDAIANRDAVGKESISNGKTIEELYNFLGTDEQKIQRYIDLYNITEDKDTIKSHLRSYEKYSNCISTFKGKQFKATTIYNSQNNIIEKVKIEAIK